VLSDDQRARWSRLARQLNTPWSALLDALESSLPDGVALVSIEPDAAQGSVRLQVEAKTLDALLAYAASLNAVHPFQSVALVKHETNEQDPTRPLRLSLEAKLNGQVASLAASKEPAR
jgi:Tfp pilus assembly protein PilN